MLVLVDYVACLLTRLQWQPLYFILDLQKQVIHFNNRQPVNAEQVLFLHPLICTWGLRAKNFGQYV